MLDSIESVVRRSLPVILCVLLALAFRCDVNASQCAPEAKDEHPQLLEEALYRVMLVPSSVTHGQPYAWKHCRDAPGGCDKRVRLFAQYFRDVGWQYGVDHWLIAAMAVKESGLNPWASGGAREIGILQMHPGRRDTRSLAQYRMHARCKASPGACQWEVVHTAVGVLRRSFEICGTTTLALGMYNSGRCRESGYAIRVFQIRRDLMRSVGLLDQAA